MLHRVTATVALLAGWEQVPQSGEAGAMATFDMTSNAAAHTGKHGARVTKAAEPAGELDVQLKGPGYALITGRTYRWAA